MMRPPPGTWVRIRPGRWMAGEEGLIAEDLGPAEPWPFRVAFPCQSVAAAADLSDWYDSAEFDIGAGFPRPPEPARC